MTAVALDGSLAVMIASTAAQHESWLSSRPEASNDRSPPRIAGGVRSNKHSSQAATSAEATPKRSASHAANSPERAGPVPHTGVRCCCLSRIKPRSLTSRSRCIANWGTRQTASSTMTSAVEPPTSSTCPATARSRSSQELTNAPPYTSTPSCFHPATPMSGRGLIRNPGESVWAPTRRRGA